ncbi:hypothetical protein EV140_0630 [Microcella alkaliphila]|uniref:Uncharacterized protein n=1 Tax=Microcella alkaliphila TaxID=279828 RepID=A0A4Q7TTS4_9MICO|nr:hypothetical protein [Microcella alkaliphila]RZT64381.1 hypothetical protein EV140_0630 [Microcella alkaliphila]
MTEPSDSTNGLQIVIENLSEEGAQLLAAGIQSSADGGALAQLIGAVTSALRPEDRAKTRLVITGDLVATVNAREDRTDTPFMMERGAGVVAAKTMPPNADGLVDILIPVYWLLPLEDVQETAEQSRLIQHLAAHEAVHASIHHIGDEPFDLHHREEFGYALMNFVSMASEQIEEHLAEYLGSQVTGREVEQSASNVEASIEAWQETLATELPAIPEDDPDYFQRGMLVTFNALHILWKTLAYLAAALRTEDGFRPVPSDIASLPGWRQHIAPWWERYLGLLGEIPMTVEVDIAATDEVVREMGLHLQIWADELGFDFHDTPQGGFFRIKLWD